MRDSKYLLREQKKFSQFDQIILNDVKPPRRCRGEEGDSTGGGGRKVMVVHHVGQSSAGSPLSTLRGKVSGWEGAG